MDRTVRHLRLRAPTAQAATHAAHRLEDALRCASLPDTGARVLLVRRLHLGRLPANLSSQSLSLLIEQRVAAVGGEWVPGDDEARAARSDTVFFNNRLEAAQAALRRRAAGLSLDDWFWPLALPGVDVHAAPADWLAQVVDGLASQPAAQPALRAWVAEAVRQGAAPWLVRHMATTTARRVLALAGTPGPAPVPARAQTPIDVDTARVLRDPHGSWFTLPPATGAPDWLPAVLCAAGWQARPEQALPAAPRSGINRVAPRPPAGEGGPPVVTAPGTPPHRAQPTRAALAPAGHGPGNATQPGPGVAPVAPVPAGTGIVVPTTAWPHFDADLATVAGGLLFLLPVLERLGFASWQADHADQPLAALVLYRALRRLPVADGDPMCSLVESLPPPRETAARCWSPPPGWRDARIGLGHEPMSPCTPDAMAQRWLLAVRRYLRRVARIGLASLCLRAAHVRWSATHLDVRFAPGQADLRVRRAGLDIDPGWLPWLERVVAFEYRAGPGERA